MDILAHKVSFCLGIACSSTESHRRDHQRNKRNAKQFEKSLACPNQDDVLIRRSFLTFDLLPCVYSRYLFSFRSSLLHLSRKHPTITLSHHRLLTARSLTHPLHHTHIYLSLEKFTFTMATAVKTLAAESASEIPPTAAAQQGDNVLHALAGAGGGILSTALTYVAHPNVLEFH
jgi:hypothetical protein